MSRQSQTPNQHSRRSSNTWLDETDPSQNDGSISPSQLEGKTGVNLSPVRQSQLNSQRGSVGHSSRQSFVDNQSYVQSQTGSVGPSTRHVSPDNSIPPTRKNTQRASTSNPSRQSFVNNDVSTPQSYTHSQSGSVGLTSHQSFVDRDLPITQSMYPQLGSLGPSSHQSVVDTYPPVSQSSGLYHPISAHHLSRHSGQSEPPYQDVSSRHSLPSFHSNSPHDAVNPSSSQRFVDRDLPSEVPPGSNWCRCRYCERKRHRRQYGFYKSFPAKTNPITGSECSQYGFSDYAQEPSFSITSNGGGGFTIHPGPGTGLHSQGTCSSSVPGPYVGRGESVSSNPQVSVQIFVNSDEQSCKLL